MRQQGALHRALNAQPSPAQRPVLGQHPVPALHSSISPCCAAEVFWVCRPCCSSLKLTTETQWSVGQVLPTSVTCERVHCVTGHTCPPCLFGGQTRFLQSHLPHVAWDLWAGRAAACTLALGQAKRRPSSHPSSTALTPPLPPVNMSLSDGKVNKFCSRLKVLIISFVNDK